jgi:hypothetical protein
VFGKWTRKGAAYRYKPDILDLKRKCFAELKPLSIPGIIDGIKQVEKYTYALRPYNIVPETGWPETPRLTYAGDVPIAYFNIEGIIFYTDIFNDLGDLALANIAAARAYASRVAVTRGVLMSLPRAATLARCVAPAMNAGIETRVAIQMEISTISRGAL